MSRVLHFHQMLAIVTKCICPFQAFGNVCDSAERKYLKIKQATSALIYGWRRIQEEPQNWEIWAAIEMSYNYENVNSFEENVRVQRKQ